MLDVTSYERNILATANILLESDTHKKAKKLWKLRTRALQPSVIKIREPQSPAVVAAGAVGATVAQQPVAQQAQQLKIPEVEKTKNPVERLVIRENESKVIKNLIFYFDEFEDGAPQSSVDR